MTVDWHTGWVEFGRINGQTVVRHFEHEGVVWYDDREGIALEGWQKALEPFEGPGHVGAPLMAPNRTN
jgi:hypothetical protein